MKTIEVRIYGRSRSKFQKCFPDAIFNGYECNIRFCYFYIKIALESLRNICKNENIEILNTTQL